MNPQAAHWRTLALQAQQRGDLAAAVDAWWQALQLEPADAGLYNDFAVLLKNLGEYATAETCLREALRLQPSLTQAWNNLGNVLRQQERAAEAMQCFERGLHLSPADAGLWLNRGNAAMQMLDLATARASYQQALQLDQNNPDIRWNLALCLLVAGDYAAAWPLYEARWQLAEAVYPYAPEQQWRGEVFSGVLLLWHEQGFGDSLQMLRAIPQLQQRLPQAELVFAGPASLWTLVQASFGLRCVDPQHPPAFAAHCPLLSLPGLLGWTLEHLPAQLPYLQADAAARAQARSILGPRQRPRVGLVWGSGAWGHGRSDRDRQRKSLPFEQLLPLLQDNGIEWCALQLGGARAELPVGANVRDLAEFLVDWQATAAIIGELDAVISVDTGVAHLAAALACPTLLLLKYDSGNFWLTSRSDSPWYPGLRIVRQARPADWPSVVAQVPGLLQQVLDGAAPSMGNK